MEVQEINNILIDQMNQYGIQRIIIDGAWGIGKTYQISKYKESINDHKDISLVYISLFGKEKINDINEVLFTELTSKAKKIFVGGLKFLSNLAASFNGIDFSIPDLSHFLKKVNLKNKKLLIIFDDFERKNENLSTIDVFGYINNLCVDNKNIKACLILNSDQFKENSKDLDQIKIYKEKTFDKEYKISKCNDIAEKEIITQFLKNNKIFESYGDVFLESFKMIKNDNLRILQAYLTELQSIISNPELDFLLDEKHNSDFSFICNIVLFVVFDCKTNEIFDERRTYLSKKIEEMKKNKSFSLDFYEAEIKDEKLIRINGISSKINADKQKNRIKNEIVKSLINHYLFLDNNYTNQIIKLKNNNYTTNIMSANLFYCSDSEKLDIVKQQYNQILKSDNLDDINLENIISNWYNQIPEIELFKIIKEKKLISHFIKIEELCGHFWISGLIKETGFVYESKLLQKFLENYFTKIKECRLKIIAKRLKEAKIEDKKTMLKYLLYNGDYFKLNQNQAKELEAILKKNNYYFPDLSSSIDDNVWDSVNILCDLITKVCSKECENKFKIYLKSILKNNKQNFSLNSRLHIY